MGPPLGTHRTPLTIASRGFVGTQKCSINVGKKLSQQRRGQRWALTAVLLVRAVATVILSVTPPVVRDAVVVLAAEFMGPARFLILSETRTKTKKNGININVPQQPSIIAIVSLEGLNLRGA